MSIMLRNQKCIFNFVNMYIHKSTAIIQCFYLRTGHNYNKHNNTNAKHACVLSMQNMSHMFDNPIKSVSY